MVDHLEIANIDVILNSFSSGEVTALVAEFKLSLNAYLKDLVASPVQSLADVIAFNKKFSDLVSIYISIDCVHLSFILNSTNIIKSRFWKND